MTDQSLAQADALLSAGRLGEAEDMLVCLAEAGDPQGLFKLGDLHYRGVGRAPDLAKARELFSASADAGFKVAGYFLTNMLASGAGGTRDWGRALKRLEHEAADEPFRQRTVEILGKMKLTADGDPLNLPARQVVSERPHIEAFMEFLTPSECGYLAYVAQPHFARSVIRDLATGKEYPDPVRTSDTATLHWAIEDPAVHAINRRIATVTQTAVNCGEPLQVFRYGVGQEFRKHVDADMQRKNVRVATVIIYLNDDFEGGETVFTRTGMFVRGGTGDAVMFRNVLPSGDLDEAAEHAGRPVTQGTKLVASRWICAGEYVP